eukprot:364743-Chlamydomonas_euryale.AAC.64
MAAIPPRIDPRYHTSSGWKLAEPGPPTDVREKIAANSRGPVPDAKEPTACVANQGTNRGLRGCAS